MARVLRSKTLSVSIERPPGDVYGFAQLPDMSEGKFAEDVRLVERDLRTLKAMLER